MVEHDNVLYHELVSIRLDWLLIYELMVKV